MVRALLLSLVTFFAGIILFAQEPAVKAASCTKEFDLNQPVGPATLDLFERALARAEKSSCESVLVLINTPGGNLQTTRKIVELILNSKLPFLCLVSPSGGHAGSAGAIILQACHVAGALNATNIGAATPISGDGKEIPKDLREKLLNDTTSWLDGMTERRGRSKEFGRDIIRDAKAVTAVEALKLKAIDWAGDSKEEFLKFAEGRSVRMLGAEKQAVKVGTISRFDFDYRHQLLSLFTDPQIAYILLMGSLALLYFEITHPGTIAPGVIGGIGLVFSLLSLHVLDVYWGGFLLILLGLVFFVLEAILPSFGILGIGGIASFVFGSILLFDTENTGIQIPWAIIIPTVIILSVVTFLLSGMAVKSFRGRKSKSVGTPDSQWGVVISVDASGTNGKLESQGEIWSFESKQQLKINDKVKIARLKGLVAIIE